MDQKRGTVLMPRSDMSLPVLGNRQETMRKWRLRLFTLAAVAAACPLAIITVWVGFQLGGELIADAIREFGQGAASAAAAASCAWMAGRSFGATRRAWALLAASAGLAFAGEIGESIYTWLLVHDAPPPSLVDIGFLVAIPFAVAGLESFPVAKSFHTSSRRILLDAAMVAFSLLFVSWALGLDQIYRQSPTALAKWTAIAFPVGDIVMGTAIFIALRRSLPSHRGRIVLLICGLAVNAFFDSANAFLTFSSSATLHDLAAVGSMYGYTMVALAPLYPENPQAREEADIALWRMLLPYLGGVAVVLTALYRVLTHQYIDPLVVLPAAGLLVVLMASQMQGYMDWVALLTKSRRAEAMVKERETMLNSLISHAPQGGARVTRDGTITGINPRMLAILQAPASAVVGAKFDDFLTSDHVEQVFSRFAVISNDSQDTVETESLAKRKNGTEIWLRWSATPIRKADGRIDYFLVMFEDVTARREADETAAANLEQLEKLSRLKSEFVAMVSHEFRTGLVGIQGFSELMRDETLEMAEVKDLAGDINKDAQRLNRMITEILDLDRLEAGRIRLEMTLVNLNELLGDAVDRAKATTNKHRWTVDLEPALPFVTGDGDRLIQVLTNLLSNAVKYSPDGGEVTVRSRLVDKNVEVAIKDQGLGIPPEFVGRLFGRYERYEDKHAGKIIGTGLGLAITRQIVEMHGGRISVDSVVGSGSEFRFTVPVPARAS